MTTPAYTPVETRQKVAFTLYQLSLVDPSLLRSETAESLGELVTASIAHSDRQTGQPVRTLDGPTLVQLCTDHLRDV